MSLIHDKYKSKCWDDLCYNESIMEQLQIIGKDEKMPNIILYGNPGAGKKNLTNLFLKYIYKDNNVFHLQDYEYKIAGNSNNITSIYNKQSPYHIVIQSYPNNNFDKYVIQNLVKMYVKNMSINALGCETKFKCVVINNIENLSYYAQMSLRRTMESNSQYCRFIFTCDSISSIIEPLKSRCICIRVPNPSDADIIYTILRICYLEKKHIEPKNLVNIVKYANHNIKNAILMLNCYFIDPNMELTNSYEVSIDKIVKLILTKNFRVINDSRLYDLPEIKGKPEEFKYITNPQKSTKIKNKEKVVNVEIINIVNLLYNILITNIPTYNIIKDIMIKLINSGEITKKQKDEIIKYATKYDLNCNIGRRVIIELTNFITMVILILNEL